MSKSCRKEKKCSEKIEARKVETCKLKACDADVKDLKVKNLHAECMWTHQLCGNSPIEVMDTLNCQVDNNIEGNVNCKGDVYSKGKKVKLDDGCDATPIDAPTTITTPGCYCLIKHITGVITIASDDVQLNLNCHRVTAGSNPNAIFIQNRKNVSIFGGSLSNATANGTCLKVATCTNVSFSDINFIGANGERAMHFNACKNVTVNSCNASGYLSTATAVVQFDSCNDMHVDGLDITECVKQLAAPISPGFIIGVTGRLLSIELCNTYKVRNVNINRNICNNNQSFNGFVQFGTGNSSNGDVRGFTLNTNDLNSGGFGFVSGYALEGVNHNIYTKNGQASKNRCLVPTAFMFGATAFDFTFQSSNLVLDGFICENNTMTAFLPNPFGSAVFCGTAWGTGVKSAELRNVRACNNSVADGAIPPPSAQHICIGITSVCDVYDSVCSDNSIGNANPGTVCAGIHTHGGSIVNCTTNNNTGGERSAGIWREVSIPGFPPFEGGDAKFENCTMMNNGGYGFMVFAIAGPADGNFNKVEFIRCTIKGNKAPAGNAAGISLPALTSVIKDIVIKDCVIDGTEATAGNANGIEVYGAKNVTIENTIINGTTASGTGHGIYLNGVNNGTVLNCQLDANKSNGVNLATCTNCLVQDSYAVSNLGTGFVNTPANTNAWLGNKAQSNGTAYSGVATGNLSTFTKATGVFLPTPPNSLSNISIV